MNKAEQIARLNQTREEVLALNTINRIRVEMKMHLMKKYKEEVEKMADEIRDLHTNINANTATYESAGLAIEELTGKPIVEIISK